MTTTNNDYREKSKTQVKANIFENAGEIQKGQNNIIKCL